MDFTVKRVLITGVSGMLGSQLAQVLLREGHEVFGMDLEPNALATCGVRVVSADVRDVHRLYQLFASMPPIDVIVHAGGVSGSMVLRDRPAQIAEINISGTVNLLEVARNAGVRRIVQCSSIMAYGRIDQNPVEENVPLAPVNVYGATKASTEAVLRAYVEEFGFSAAALRIAHVYGPARKTYCPLGDMVKAAVAGQPVEIEGASGSRRQFVHSRDVVEAIRLAVVQENRHFDIINIGPGSEQELSEVEEVVRTTVGPVDVRYTAEEPSEDYVTPILAVDAAKDLYGWSPKVDLASGIKDYAATIRKAR